jgi:phage terminase large subunit
VGLGPLAVSGITYDHPEVVTTLRGGNAEAFEAEDEEVVLEGPAGTGKTLGLLTKADCLCREHDGVRGLLLRKTRVSMNQTVLETFEQAVLIGAGSDRIKAGPQRPWRSSYDYPNGSTLVLGGMDNPDRIMSSDFDFAFAFEATELTANDWEVVTTRLRHGRMPYQQAVADCNPGPVGHWINLRAKAGGMRRIYSRHEDNPRWHNGRTWTHAGERYIAKLDRLTGPRYQRLRLGKWASAEGVVWEGFDPAVHVVEPFTIPEGWRRYRTIDFGYANPFVCQWWAQDGDGRLYLYREVYMSGRTLDVHGPQIIELSGDESYDLTIADAEDAEGRARLEQLGIPNVPAHKGKGSVRRGIQAVADRLVVQDDGKPRLFIVRGATVEYDAAMGDLAKPTATMDEIEGYHYPTPRDHRAADEHPVKVDDHGCDAMRYLVDAIDGRAAPVVIGAASAPVPRSPRPEINLRDRYDDPRRAHLWR